MVLLMMGTFMRFFFASSIPLRIASGPSCASPRPLPTVPFPSPTTTRALKPNLPPPFTTLATLLIFTTRSVNSRSLESLVSTPSPPLSKFEAFLTRCLCELLYPAVVQETVAIEDHPLDPLLQRLLREELADGLGCPGVARGLEFPLQFFAEGRRGCQGLPGDIVDDLGIDVIETPVDGEAGALRGPPPLLPDPRLPLQPPGP